MITAVDANVLLDVFLPDDRFGPQSREQLRIAYSTGTLIACDVVYAELVPAFRDRAALDRALQGVNVLVSPVDTAIAYEAGLRWARYRRAGGPRQRILPDFLIGAHALATADAFLTRDRGFFESYFPDLRKV